MITFTKTGNSVEMDTGTDVHYLSVEMVVSAKVAQNLIYLQESPNPSSAFIKFRPTEVNGRPGDPILTVAEWLRDTYFTGLPSGGGGGGPIEDGVSAAIKATVLDYTNSNPLAVRLTDTNGDYIAAGAGTQYTEDAVAPADPIGTAVALVRADTPGAVTGTNGDIVAQRATNYGAAYTQIVTSTGSFVDSFGGGTQYTEGDVDATITGTAMMMEGAGNTLVAAPGTAADGLLVNLGANNDVTVTGTVTVDSELPTAETPADNLTNATAAPRVNALGYVFDGATWDRALGNSTDGALVNLGANNDVTVTSISAGDNNIGNVDIVTVPAPLSTSGGGTEAAALRVTIANDSTGLVSVDDNAGSLTVDAPVGTPVNVQIGDGANTATVRNLAANDALNVAIVDGAGAHITSFGGGTEYTEDAPAAFDPIGKANILVRLDTPTTITSTDGDNIAQRGTNYGAAYVQLVTSAGAYIDSVGGGTEYTEDAAAAANPVGKATIFVRQDTLSATTVDADGDNIAARAASTGAQYVEITAGTTKLGSAADGVLVNLGTNNDVTVTGTVTANAGTNLNTSALNLETTQADVRTAVQLIDDTVQVLGTDTFTEATSKGITLGAVRRDADTTLVNTTNEFTPLQVDANGRLKVEIFDGGDSHTVDGTVSVSGAVDTELPAAETPADNLTNATAAPRVNALGYVFDGTAWDRALGNSTDGTLVNLGANNDVSLNAGTNTNEMVGDVAHSVAAAGNPLLICGISQDMDDTAPPNQVDAESDATRIAVDRDGAVFVRPFGPRVWSYHENSSSTLTDTTVKAAPGAGLSLYVTTIVVSTGSATAFNIFFEEGASTVLGPYYLEAVNGRGFVINFTTPKKITANTALTVTTSAAIAHAIDVTGFTAAG